MKLNPLSNRVVIKFIEAEEKTSGGIFLTAAAQEKPEIAEVVAVVAVEVTCRSYGLDHRGESCRPSQLLGIGKV